MQLRFLKAWHKTYAETKFTAEPDREIGDIFYFVSGFNRLCDVSSRNYYIIL